MEGTRVNLVVSKRLVKSRDYFLRSCILIFLLTATVKLVSALGTEKILNTKDPLTNVLNRHLYFAIGIVELWVVRQLWRSGFPWLKLSLVAWLSTMFMIYRFGLYWFKIAAPCPCLGNAYSWLGMDPHIFEAIASFLLFYLLIGGYVFLALELGFISRRAKNAAYDFQLGRAEG